MLLWSANSEKRLGSIGVFQLVAGSLLALRVHILVYPSIVSISIKSLEGGHLSNGFFSENLPHWKRISSKLTFALGHPQQVSRCPFPTWVTHGGSPGILSLSYSRALLQRKALALTSLKGSGAAYINIVSSDSVQLLSLPHLASCSIQPCPLLDTKDIVL